MYSHVYLSICLLVYLSTCLFVYLSICLFVYLSTCLLVYLSTCLLVYLSTCLLVYLSTCLLVYLVCMKNRRNSMGCKLYFNGCKSVVFSRWQPCECGGMSKRRHFLLLFHSRKWLAIFMNVFWSKWSWDSHGNCSGVRRVGKTGTLTFSVHTNYTLAITGSYEEHKASHRFVQRRCTQAVFLHVHLVM